MFNGLMPSEELIKDYSLAEKKAESMQQLSNHFRHNRNFLNVL